MVFIVVALFSFYLCCCHGRQLFVEDHPHHALHPASNSLARLSSLVRLARLRPSATSMLHTIQYFGKSPHILQVPRLDPDPYTRIAHIIFLISPIVLVNCHTYSITLRACYTLDSDLF